MSKIIFLIFEKAFLIRKGIVSIIEEIENCEVINKSAEVEHFYSLIKTHKPHVIIIDMDLLQTVPLSQINRIKEESHCYLIGISSLAESPLKLPIDEYFSYFEEKESIIKKIIPAIERVIKKPSIKKMDHELSKREKDVVALVAKGLTNKEIADNLFISIHTAMTHRKNIVRKLGIKTVSGITVYAILNKLIDMKDLK